MFKISVHHVVSGDWSLVLLVGVGVVVIVELEHGSACVFFHIWLVEMASFPEGFLEQYFSATAGNLLESWLVTTSTFWSVLQLVCWILLHKK